MYELKLAGRTISQKIKIADTMTSRMIGLMFAKDLEGYDALWITPCNQIHTFFMKFDLDVIFLSRNNTIVKIVKDIKPFRLTWLYFRAASVLEFKSGTLDPQLKEGDKLELVCIS